MNQLNAAPFTCQRQATTAPVTSGTSSMPQAPCSRGITRFACGCCFVRVPDFLQSRPSLVPLPASCACSAASRIIWLRGAGLIHAERLLGQEVAGGGVGARAAAHADVAEFAAAALAFEVVVVAQLLEDLRVVPDFGEALLAQVAGQRRQIAAGENFAFVREEANAGSRQAAFGHGVHVAGMSAGMSGVSDRRCRRPASARFRWSPAWSCRSGRCRERWPAASGRSLRGRPCGRRLCAAAPRGSNAARRWPSTRCRLPATDRKTSSACARILPAAPSARRRYPRRIPPAPAGRYAARRRPGGAPGPARRATGAHCGARWWC